MDINILTNTVTNITINMVIIMAMDIAIQKIKMTNKVFSKYLYTEGV